MYRLAGRMMPVLATVVSVAGLAAHPAVAAKPANHAKHVKQTRHKVTGQQTTITPSAQATQFLTNHQVTVSAVGPATLANGTLTLPISGGFVKTPSLNGRLVHRGGVKFTRGAQSLTLRGFVLSRVAHQTLLTARAGGHDLIVARLANFATSTTGAQTTVTGELKLTRAAAKRINRRFGQHIVGAGADIGALKSTVTIA